MDKDKKPKIQEGLNSFMKKQQHWILLVVICLCCIAIVLFYWITRPQITLQKQKKQTETKFVSPLSQASDSLWREQQNNLLSQTQNKTTQLENKLNSLKQLLRKQNQRLQAQSQEIKQFTSKINQVNSISHSSANAHVFGEVPGKKPRGLHNQQHIKINTIELDNLGKTSQVHNTKNYVPSGSFIRAVLLSGLDAPTGVNNQAQPIPILLRLVSWGSLPNAAHSHIKNCFMTGAGIGNISAERAYIRTERMSCTLNNGNIIDIPVEATVVGPDGKDGVRGPVVWREQAMVERAAAAGVLSGFSNALSQAYTTQSISPLGSTTTVNNKQLLQYGLASGASNGMDKLADYFIKRAEEYQPVIEVSAGTTVDVMVLKGFSLAPRQHERAEHNNANTANLFGDANG